MFFRPAQSVHATSSSTVSSNATFAISAAIRLIVFSFYTTLVSRRRQGYIRLPDNVRG